MTSTVTRGVVFDLDGTLVDSYDAITRSLNHALRSLGEEPLAAARVRQMVGRGIEVLVERALGGPERVAEAVRLFREEYAQVAVEMTEALPDVQPTLATLSDRGYRMGVASNKPARFCRIILEHLGMLPFMTDVLGPDVVENAKPHPEMVHRLLTRFELDAREVVYVGDMGVDAETCRNAGVVCWLIPTGSCSAAELQDAGGDRLLERFTDLLDLLPPL